MSKKTAIIPILILAAAGSAGGWWYKQKKPAKFYYAGTIEATKVDISARLATVISTFSATEGVQVEKNQTLVSLECEELAIQNRLAEENFQRGQKLLHSGSMPREQFAQLQARRDEVALKSTWCQVTSPIKGTVLTRYREPGEWVAPGSKLLTLADLEQVWVYVYVPQTLLAQLKLGMTVSGFLPELGMRRLEGAIVKVNEEAEFTPKNVQTRDERTRLVFGIKIRFPNPEGLLKPGMPVEIDLQDDGHLQDDDHG